MGRVFLFLLCAAATLAADDPWAKVKNLGSGTEIRVYQRGSAQPLIANFDELRDDNLIVVVKNRQSAIPRDQIDRLDARPAKTGNRVTRETKVTTEPAPANSQGKDSGKQTTSYSSSVVFGGSKPDFETIYRRGPAPPAKEPSK